MEHKHYQPTIHPQQQQQPLVHTNHQQDNWAQTLLSKVGGSSHYQLLLFIHFGVKWILAGMIIFCLNFIYIAPQFVCTSEELLEHPSCEEYVCSEDDTQFWISHLKYPLPSSIVVDYEIMMICSNKWISSFLQFFIFLGSFVGELGMSHMADNYGRKSTQAYSWLITIVGLLLLVFSVNLQFVALGTFLSGLGVNATTNLHYTFLKQLIVGKYRQSSFVALQILFSLGISLISVASYIVPHWRVMIFLFVIVPSIVLYYYSSIIQQTPHFSLHRSKNTLLQSLNRIANINNNPQLNKQDLDIIPIQMQKDESYSLRDLFEYESLRNITIICGFVNLIMEFMYDSTILSLDKIGVDVHTNQFVVGIVEMAAAIFSSYIVMIVKRKQITILSMALAAIITLLLALTSDHNNTTVHQVVLMGLLRFDLNCVWGIFFVYAGQLFPSDVTSLSLGFISAVGTLGAFVSPFIRLLTAQNTMFTMSIMCFMALPLLRKLPQTKGMAIRQRIKQRQQK